MAEGGVNINRRDEAREEEREEEEELNTQLEEVSLENRVRERAKCESCVREECPRPEGAKFDEVERYERARELYGRVAVFFCFLCKMLVCAECLRKHQWHEGQKVEREEGEGMEEQRERERKRRVYIEHLFQSENETEREQNFFSSHPIICDRVDVKHELDQGKCLITGLCGLGNKSLVVCDCDNFCIKIFKLGSHVLQRYIRFVESRRVVGSRPEPYPWDVTEIDSTTDRGNRNRQCLIAVTLPKKHQIIFIDLSKIPAEPRTMITTEGECYSIQFNNDNIFTVCREGPDRPWSVFIYSTDGDPLNMFDTGIYHDDTGPYLAVVSGRVYLTDEDNKKVQSRNVEDIPEITIEGSWPEGISVDPDNNVYVCAWFHNELYKLDADLTRYNSVLDQKTDYIPTPWALCYYRDKLFIGHIESPSIDNFVTVVRLL